MITLRHIWIVFATVMPMIQRTMMTRAFRAMNNNNRLKSVSRSFSLHGRSNIDRPFTPFLISLEGNIGAGKTTLLTKLRELHPDWIPIDEPVEEWCNIKNEKGESILELFYRDKRRWAYTFQSCVLLTRYNCIEKTIRDAKVKSTGGVQVFLTERCMDSDYHVFAKLLREEGCMDSMEFQIYERLLSQLSTTATPLSAIIHVNNSPVICQDRIKQRGRRGESAITSAYLQSLDAHQTAWLASSKIPILSTSAESLTEVEAFISNEISQMNQRSR